MERSGEVLLPVAERLWLPPCRPSRFHPGWRDWSNGTSSVLYCCRLLTRGRKRSGLGCVDFHAEAGYGTAEQVGCNRTKAMSQERRGVVQSPAANQHSALFLIEFSSVIY